MKQPDIVTDRLILRPFNPKDAKPVTVMAGNFNVSKMTMNIPHPYTLDMAREWIKTHSQRWKLETGASYAVTDKHTKELFGAISLVSILDGQANMGYWIGEPYWNNGYCSEASLALVKYAFSSLGITRVYAEHLSRNPASGKVMQNIGMNHYETKNKPDRDGKLVSMELYEIKCT